MKVRFGSNWRVRSLFHGRQLLAHSLRPAYGGFVRVFARQRCPPDLLNGEVRARWQKALPIRQRF